MKAIKNAQHGITRVTRAEYELNERLMRELALCERTRERLADELAVATSRGNAESQQAARIAAAELAGERERQRQLLDTWK